MKRPRHHIVGSLGREKPHQRLQEIIIAYAQHLYTEGRFRALDSSIEYPYVGPAFAFRLNGKCLELIDNTQETLTSPDGEEIVVPADHRDFREPKSNQVRAALLKFRHYEKKIHRTRKDGRRTNSEKLQRELEIVRANLMPLAIDMLRPTAESYSLHVVDPEAGQDYWAHPPCDLKCQHGMLESGESVPAEIQAIVEEFNDLLREYEKRIEHGEPTPPRSQRTERMESRQANTAGDLAASIARREAVNAYIDEVLKKTGKRITRTEIWKKAGYKSRTEFERWERDDRKNVNKTANERFTRLLSEKPHLK